MVRKKKFTLSTTQIILLSFLVTILFGSVLLAVKKGDNVNVNINPEQILDAETTLIVIANTAKLSKLK